MTSQVGVAIVGASGYAARELIRILLNHPRARITAATSRQDEAPRLDALHPAWRGGSTWPASRSTPTGSPSGPRSPSSPCRTPRAWPSCRPSASASVRVIDLSADYRLTDPQVYADWYGHAHTDPTGLREAVYGLPELFRERIPPAGLIANPGCYTSTSILALAPLVAEDLIERTGHHHRRQERRLGGGAVAQADDSTSPSATRASRPTTSAGTGTRPRSTRC